MLNINRTYLCLGCYVEIILNTYVIIIVTDENTVKEMFCTTIS